MYKGDFSPYLSVLNRNQDLILLQFSNQFANTFSSANLLFYSDRIITSKHIRFLRIAMISNTYLHFIIIKGDLRNSRRVNRKNSSDSHLSLIDYFVMITDLEAKVKGFVPLRGVSHLSNFVYK